MSTELALPADVAALQAAYGTDMGDIAGSGVNFLPRFQLFGSRSNEVQEQKIAVANFGILKYGLDTPIDLGKSALISPLGWRSKAMFLKGGDKSKPTSYFNRESDKFKEYRELADKNGELGYVYGPEFLVIVSGHGLCSFYLSSKTLRNLATALNAFCPTPASPAFKTVLCNARLIDNGTYKWHAPTFAPSSQEIQNPPSSDEIKATMEAFFNPVDRVEVVKEAVKEGDTVVR